jgi:hypothetical protein
MSGLVAKLRAGTGDPALVVAHQDTLPKIIATLGGGEIKPIADNQFDQLFVIILDGAKARLMTLHYCDGGGPAPAADKSQGMRPQP